MVKNINKVILLILILGAGFCIYAPDFAVGQADNEASLINKEVKDLNSDIDSKKNQIKKMQNKQKEYSDTIVQKQSEKASLNNQLAILDNRLAKAELDIELVETDIELVKLEMQKTDISIADKSKEIEEEREDIVNVLRLLQKKDNVSTLEIMLINSTLSDFLSQVKYLEDISDNVKASLEDLKKFKSQLEKEKRNLEEQSEDLDKFKNDLTDKQKQLESEQETKLSVLQQVSQSERQYQKLLAEAKQEQEDASAEIASLEKLVRAKIAALEGRKLEFNDEGLIWPVTKNIITAYFHDPEYPFRYIFEHPGVDVRAGQGTALKAAASGYVARTKDGGKSGYSYIMIIHGDGLSTVYGHVSKIYIAEDDYVVQGQTIGLTGGLPGTPGAGMLTTGPHLHFEVRLNGIPVDPLSYLP